MSKSLFLILLWCLIQCQIRCTKAVRGKKRPRPTSAPLHRCFVAPHDFVKEGCACNFIGACSLDSNKKYQSFKGDSRTIDTYIPEVKQFAEKPSLVVKICEPGELGIIYDCGNRIPLAASIVLTKNDYESVYNTKMRKKDFGSSEIIHPNYRQRADDYKGSLTHKPCYRNTMGQIVYEQEWYRALTSGTVAVNQACGSSSKPRASIHRGHLIAAQYGRGGRVAETFLYTNVVPQFGILNSGAWNQHEISLMEWANEHCNGFPLHVIVGCVPSGFARYPKRFFGKAGFSNYQGTLGSNENFAINVPSLMWTVACCGSGKDAKNTGFYAKNIPKRMQVDPISPFNLIQMLMGINSGVSFNFFPKARGDCEDDKNYKDIN